MACTLFMSQITILGMSRPKTFARGGGWADAVPVEHMQPLSTLEQMIKNNSMSMDADKLVADRGIQPKQKLGAGKTGIKQRVYPVPARHRAGLQRSRQRFCPVMAWLHNPSPEGPS
jgi:hypothetical protein